MSTTLHQRAPVPKQLYRLPVILLPEEEGGFSALAATLSGAASQGDTEAEFDF